MGLKNRLFLAENAYEKLCRIDALYGNMLFDVFRHQLLVGMFTVCRKTVNLRPNS
jgi:hypothetical protein